MPLTQTEKEKALQAMRNELGDYATLALLILYTPAQIDPLKIVLSFRQYFSAEVILDYLQILSDSGIINVSVNPYIQNQACA